MSISFNETRCTFSLSLRACNVYCFLVTLIVIAQPDQYKCFERNTISELWFQLDTCIIRIASICISKQRYKWLMSPFKFTLKTTSHRFNETGNLRGNDYNVNEIRVACGRAQHNSIPSKICCNRIWKRSKKKAYQVFVYCQPLETNCQLMSVYRAYQLLFMKKKLFVMQQVARRP